MKTLAFTLIPILLFASVALGVEIRVVDELEDIGANQTEITSRIINGITVNFSTKTGITKTKRYNGGGTAFTGHNGQVNAPLNPANVSGTRFISASMASRDYFEDVQPITFIFSSRITSFGLTTLDLLETNVGSTETVRLLAFRSNGILVAHQTRTGPQGASGLDLDWFVTSASQNIAYVKLTGTLTTGGGYGLDDLIVGVNYDPPLLTLTPDVARINTSDPSGDSAVVQWTVASSGGSAAASGELFFGDGASSVLTMPLPRTLDHGYSLLPGEDSHTFTASASATNAGGTGNASADIRILRQPDVALLVNGLAVLDGETIEVEADELLSLSLVGSLGYIEERNFAITGLLDQSGAGADYLGTLFGDPDIGQVHSLTVGASNTGSGVNSDSMTVNLSVVPEPATLTLLAFGGLAVLRRRRKQ